VYPTFFDHGRAMMESYRRRAVRLSARTGTRVALGVSEPVRAGRPVRPVRVAVPSTGR
jgi:hypothetical protein